MPKIRYYIVIVKFGLFLSDLFTNLTIWMISSLVAFIRPLVANEARPVAVIQLLKKPYEVTHHSYPYTLHVL